jgi:hypothetical protein
MSCNFADPDDGLDEIAGVEAVNTRSGNCRTALTVFAAEDEGDEDDDLFGDDTNSTDTDSPTSKRGIPLAASSNDADIVADANEGIDDKAPTGRIQSASSSDEDDLFGDADKGTAPTKRRRLPSATSSDDDTLFGDCDEGNDNDAPIGKCSLPSSNADDGRDVDEGTGNIVPTVHLQSASSSDDDSLFGTGNDGNDNERSCRKRPFPSRALSNNDVADQCRNVGSDRTNNATLASTNVGSEFRTEPKRQQALSKKGSIPMDERMPGRYNSNGLSLNMADAEPLVAFCCFQCKCPEDKQSDAFWTSRDGGLDHRVCCHAADHSETRCIAYEKVCHDISKHSEVEASKDSLVDIAVLRKVCKVTKGQHQRAKNDRQLAGTSKSGCSLWFLIF